MERLTNGRFASELQKAQDEAKKYKQLCKYLLSLQRGQNIRIRQLAQQANDLRFIK